jgi:hypothetical protein
LPRMRLPRQTSVNDPTRMNGRTRLLAAGILIGVTMTMALAFGVFSRYLTSYRAYNVIGAAMYSPSADTGALRIPEDFFDVEEHVSLPSTFQYNAVSKERERLIVEGARFIYADLTAMQLFLYENGEVVDIINILTRGKKGSWWDTPSGIYTAGVRTPKHFSSIGNVYMPWSIQFQGNFFIHGWPYYPDGTPVESTYSGGCIRLSVPDSKKVYDFAAESVRVPILISDVPSEARRTPYIAKQTLEGVSAFAYIAADLDNGSVFFSENANDELPIASVTKLMTALVASEYVYLGREIRVSEAMLAANGSTSGLTAGKVFSAHALLYPLLTESSNDAAEVLARFLGRSSFVTFMNAQARSLAMSETVFADPSGISDHNVSTASDLLRLAKYIYEKRSFILDITRGENFDFFGDPVFLGLKNFNRLTDIPEFHGGKVGHTTAAQDTMLSVFVIVDDAGVAHPIGISVLGSQHSLTDTQLIFRTIKERYF